VGIVGIVCRSASACADNIEENEVLEAGSVAGSCPSITDGNAAFPDPSRFNSNGGNSAECDPVC